MIFDWKRFFFNYLSLTHLDPVPQVHMSVIPDLVEEEVHRFQYLL